MKEKMYTICKITAAAFCLLLLFTIKNVYADDSYTFQIKYNRNGGYWQDAEGNLYEDESHNLNPTEITTKDSNEEYELTAPVREGYHFTGWRVDSRYAATITNALTVENQPDETGTLTESTLIIHGFPAEDPAETQELQSQFEFLQNLSGNACYTLTAQWEKNVYTVTFDSHGGSPVAQQMVQYQEKVTRPEDPTKDGLRFDLWYTDQALDMDFDFTEGVTGDIILHAGWLADVCLGVYNRDNPGADPAEYPCGTVDIEEVPTSQGPADYQVAEPIRDLGMDDPYFSFAVVEGIKMKFTAKPAAGFTFAGWYEGIPGKRGNDIDSEPIAEKPSENCLSEELTYTTTADTAKYLCAVFQCAEHHWGNNIIVNPTKTADGRIYRKCTNCGAEDIINVIPKTGGSGNSSGNTNPDPTKIIIRTITTDGIENASAVSRKGANAKAANPLQIKGKKVTVKYSKLKNKAQKIKIKKAIKFINKGVGRKTYIKIKGNSKIQINRKTGKITIKKGLEKGTYKVKIMVTAQGNNSYKAGYKTVTCKIKVR